jgi:CBS domain-containing protein
MKIVKNILEEKGFDVYTITSDATVYETLQKMAEKNIGALMVMEEDKIVGMISERAYARKILLKGKFSKDVPVSEIMETNLIHVTQEQDIETCMELISGKRVRHLPVVENDRLVGIISIGDIVKAMIEHRVETIDHLEKYIKGHR